MKGDSRGYHAKRLRMDSRYRGLALLAYDLLKPTPTWKKEPSRVLDLGCSCGAFLQALSKLMESKEDALFSKGVDGSPHAQKLWVLDPEAFALCNLEDEVYHDPNDKPFDLVVCTEVAEHVEYDQNLLETFHKNTVRGSLLWFSAAKVGQRGRGHVNCQPSAYWLERLGCWDFQPLPYDTNHLCYEMGRYNAVRSRNDQIPSFYLNSMIFVRK